jgi:hypothetical protein
VRRDFLSERKDVRTEKEKRRNRRGKGKKEKKKAKENGCYTLV